MNPIAKMLMILGGVLFLLGVLWHFGSGLLHLGRLPGDIVIERENVKIYIPIMTSLLLSVLLSILISVIYWLSR